MARLYISDFIRFGATYLDIEMTSWEVYEYDDNNTDKKGDLLFSSIDDEVNKLGIIATLRKLNGELFEVENKTIAFVKVKAFNSPYTNWYSNECSKQLIQQNGI